MIRSDRQGAASTKKQSTIMSDRTSRAGKRGLPKDDRTYEEEDDNTSKVVLTERASVLPKRPRSEGAAGATNSDTDTNSSTIDLFSNDLIATAVCSFLDVRELLHLSMCSKFISEQIRYEHVVVSALMHGGHAKTSMQNLVRLLRNTKPGQQQQLQHRKIYVPSPLRMLRLMNGKRCEQCGQARVSTVPEDFGVFFCSKCRFNSFYTKQVARNNNTWSPFLEHPRVAAAVQSARYCIFSHTYYDAAGDACGPLLTMADLKVIVRGQTTDDLLRKLNEADKNGKHADAIVKVFDQTQKAAENRALEEYRRKSDDARRKALLNKQEKGSFHCRANQHT